MKKCIFILSAIFLTILCGCSKWAGDPITEKFSIEGSYTELFVEDAFDVYVCDTVDQIFIMAGENIMPKVVVKNSGNKLQIYLKGWTTNRGANMKVILPYNSELRKVNLSGASDFHSDYPLKAQKVEIFMSGASDFFGNIEAGDVDIDLSGSSDINGSITATNLILDMSGSSDANIIGQVGTLKIDISGASSIEKGFVGNRYAFVCDRCEGSMTGSSYAYIHCDGSIFVSLSGSSSLYYTGNAVTRGSSTSGSSDIIHDVFR